MKKKIHVTMNAKSVLGNKMAAQSLLTPHYKAGEGGTRDRRKYSPHKHKAKGGEGKVGGGKGWGRDGKECDGRGKGREGEWWR